MLGGLINDERVRRVFPRPQGSGRTHSNLSQVLKSLVATFFSPDMAQNQQVRQCLSYFFPAYCYSSSSNQTQLQKVSFRSISKPIEAQGAMQIAIPILQLLFDLHREVEAEDAAMVSPSQMALLMVD